MSLFYVTFGQQYAREPHLVGDFIHPDGYVTIEAPDEDLARQFTQAWTNGQYCALYGEDSPDAPPRYVSAGTDLPGYPQGELARLRVTRNPDSATTVDVELLSASEVQRP